MDSGDCACKPDDDEEQSSQFAEPRRIESWNQAHYIQLFVGILLTDECCGTGSGDSRSVDVPKIRVLRAVEYVYVMRHARACDQDPDAGVVEP